jgi:hypothetical protein
VIKTVLGLAGDDAEAEADGVFFAPLVPGLLVVVVGYLIGYGVTTLLDHVLDAAFGLTLGARTPEVVGWVVGLALLMGVLRWALRRRRRHQK